MFSQQSHTERKQLLDIKEKRWLNEGENINR